MLLALLPLLPFAAAHFQLTWPDNRGFSSDGASNFPCGGFNDVSSERTQFPISGGPIQLDLEHPETKIQVVLALGDGEGSYSIELVPTFEQQGPGDFCLGQVTFPSDLNITEGMNGTLQVITNGDPDGGLYQCGDITFTNTALTPEQYGEHCQNGTGQSVSALSGGPSNANGSASNDASPTGGNAVPEPTSSGLAAQATVAQWALGAMGVLGMVAAL